MEKGFRRLAIFALVVLLAFLSRCADAQASSSLLNPNQVSLAVRTAALPNGVSQILTNPGLALGVGSNSLNNVPVPGYGASIAWTPTTTGAPRVIVGSIGAITTPAATNLPLQNNVFGAAYVYTSSALSFTLLQTLLPGQQTPGIAGDPGTDPNSRFGTVICASQRPVTSPVLSGTNLWISQPFAVPMNRGDETVYFYSASTQTQDLTRMYLFQQALRINAAVSTGFGTSMAVSNDDRTVIVGAPGYRISETSTAYSLQGPLVGTAYVFGWNPTGGSNGRGAYTAQSILQAVNAGSQFAQELGFGIAVAMSGNTFVVGSMGGTDRTGQWLANVGNVYVFVLQAPQANTIGDVSAISTARFVQVLPRMPVSNAMAISMSGNYLIVGVQALQQVTILLSAPISRANPMPNYNQQTSYGGCSQRFPAGGCVQEPRQTGMGQIVQSQLVDDRLWVYMGQPNGNIGAIFAGTAPNVNNFINLGIQGGLEPGFGTAIAFNTGGNYLFAGNSAVQPHALVISIYFETLGKAAARQRLISNDVQTAGAGVFSNYGSVISGNTNSAQSLIAIGAPIGPTTRGSVFIYLLNRSVSPIIFSFQAQLQGDPGTNFGASIATMLSTGGDIAIIVGAPAQTGANGVAYVDIFFASATVGILASAVGEQRLVAPICIPPSGQIQCGGNYGGAVVVDGTQIVVGAHSFGIQTGTGRVYIYVANPALPRRNMFSLQQTLVSPDSEFGFGVGLALGQTFQATNQPPPAGAQCQMTGTQPRNTCGMLFVGAMGYPRSQAGDYPFNMPPGVGSLYVYVNTGSGSNTGQTYSLLQVLVNTPVQITDGNIGTGASMSVVSRGNDLFVGSIWRNEVRFYSYNGGLTSTGGLANSFSLQQVLVSPYGDRVWGSDFGCSLFVTPNARGLFVGAVGNGTVFLYLNPSSAAVAGSYSLIRALQAAPRADNFGAAVGSSGASVIVGAPGANVATLFPLAEIRKLPAARPSGSPTPINSAPPANSAPPVNSGPPVNRPSAPPALVTRNPSADPALPRPSVFPTPARPALQPTAPPTMEPTWAAQAGSPTRAPALRPTNLPTTQPTRFPVYTAFTPRFITPFYACSKNPAVYTDFLLGMGPTPRPTPNPTPSPTTTSRPTRRPTPIPTNRSPNNRPPASKVLEEARGRGEAPKDDAAAEEGFTLEELLGERGMSINRMSGQKVWNKADAEVQGSTTTITIDSKILADQAQHEQRSLGGGGGGPNTMQSAPTSAPVMPFLGFWDQQLQNQLGWQPEGSSLPKTKYFLDIKMAATGWGNQGNDHGQYITFYANLAKNSGPDKVTCDIKLAVADPECSENYYNGWQPCTGKLHPIYTYWPHFDPAHPQCSESVEDWLMVAENIDVTNYINQVQGGSLILTYITTGVTQPVCPYKDHSGNSDVNIVVEYMLSSVNPFPTFEPTLSVEEEEFLGFAGTSELSPGFGVYVLCLIVGVIVYCIVGFRLAVVRSTSAKEEITPVNGFMACLYLSLLGCGLLLDIALSIVVIQSELGGLHIFGFGILIARLLMVLPSIYIISKVYQGGEGAVTQLDDRHFEENGLTYAFFSLFVIFDTQLLAYYPWKVSQFTKVSGGYPDFERIRMSTYPKLVSTIVVLACEGALLDHIHYEISLLESHYHDTMHLEAALLSFVTITVVFTVFVLCTVLYEMVKQIPLNKFVEGKGDIMGAEKLGEEHKDEDFDDSRSVHSARGSQHGGQIGSPMAAFAPMHAQHPLGRHMSVTGTGNLPPHMMHRQSLPGNMPPHMVRSSFTGSPPQHRTSVASGRFMPPGAIHMPQGSPSPPGRRMSQGGPPPPNHFNAANPRPPMGGGRSPSVYGGHQQF